MLGRIAASFSARAARFFSRPSCFTLGWLFFAIISMTAIHNDQRLCRAERSTTPELAKYGLG